MTSPERPFDLDAWLSDNSELLRPPVSNHQFWPESDMIVMVVGGGNRRTDYHDDPAPEFFHQIRGDMFLRIVDEPGRAPRDVAIREGEIFLLAPHVRHSPQRPDPDSVGNVVENSRPAGAPDGFEWYCASCHGLVHRTEVMLGSIVDDLPPLFEAFYGSEDARRCPTCGTVHPGEVAAG
ncbi:MAG: 3-hydroxyanthranilate 3,4-dioxygenase [Acidimicrobiales bacterium]